MPLDPSNPAYLAEITPSSIAAMERPLCSAYGVGFEAFGAKGNTVHTSGYHRSRQWILTSPDSRYGSRDYSVIQQPDLSGDWRWVSAFDFTPGAWGTADNRSKMRQITGRVYAAALARDPRLADLREFAGTLDGSNVITFNCADGTLKSPFDSSHLDHCHGSFWRSRANNDHTGIIEVMLGQQEAPDMDSNQSQMLTNVHEWLLNYLQGHVTGTWPHSTGALPRLVPNEQLAAILAELAAGVGQAPTQEQGDAGVRNALTDPAVIGALVKAINDDAARRAAE